MHKNSAFLYKKRSQNGREKVIWWLKSQGKELTFVQYAQKETVIFDETDKIWFFKSKIG